MIQRRPIQRHQLAIGAGLAVGDDDVGVQVRITRAGGLMLVGDRHQTGQAHQILLPGDRVVDAGVSGMIREVFQRLRDRGRVRVDDGFMGHLARADRAGQRHTFRGAERQVEAVHTTVPERPPARAIGCCAVIQPALHNGGIRCPAGTLNVGQTDQFDRGARVAGAHPHRGAGVVLSVVLPQPATSTLGISGRRAGGTRGVVVVVDRPPRQLRNRQHVPTARVLKPPGAQPRRKHTKSVLPPISHTGVQMCHSQRRIYRLNC